MKGEGGRWEGDRGGGGRVKGENWKGSGNGEGWGGLCGKKGGKG